MTEYQILKGKMIAPENGVVFSFNPCLLTFSGIKGVDKMIITFVDNDYYSDNVILATAEAHLRNGFAQIDISAYLRIPFAGKAKGTDTFKTSALILVQIGDDTGELHEELEFVSVYGAMLPGEVFNPSRIVKMWSAYPQVVSFYHPSQYDGEVAIYLQKDDAMPEMWQLPQGDYEDAGISNYDNQAQDTPMVYRGQVVLYPSMEVTTTTFTMQFDGTFTGIGDNVIINIEIDDRPQCDDHIFLRWLDKWGFWQYWLYKVGEVQVTDAVVGEAIAVLAGTTYQYYATRNIGKSMVKQVTACASSVTAEEWDFLSGIKGSVNVCAFDIASQSWIPVNIAAGSSAFKHGNQSNRLQDFIAKIVYPATQTQRL